jgi:perosamine synthetase
MLLVKDTNSIQEVLTAIDKNAQGVAFVTDKGGVLVGVLTDGDIRRALLSGKTLQTPANQIISKDFESLPVTAASDKIAKLLSDKIRHIPLLDQQGKVVDYACKHKLHQIPVMEPYLNGNEEAYVLDCLKTKWISSQGKYVTQFEDEFAKLCGGGFPVAVSNGTVALHLAMLALDIGPGDEVIVPDFTFAASINTVIHAGATPVLVDCNTADWCIDPQAIEKAVTPKTKAIMPVHLYGQPCDMAAIEKIAKKHKLAVIEDCAEAMGSLYSGRAVGTFGDAGSFSFFGNKMVTTGEGGMILFKSKTAADRAKILRDHGMSKERRYWHLEVGYNYRLTNLQAAIGVAQLEQFETILKKKLKIAAGYRERLSEIPGITLPPAIPHTRNIYWLYSILLDESIFGSRDQVIEKLAANGIQSRPLFYPLHQMPPYKQFVRDQNFPVTDDLAARGISLPSSAQLSMREMEHVCMVLNQIPSVRKMAGSTSRSDQQ